MNHEELIRLMASSRGITMGTDAPYDFANLRIEKVGFADIPRVAVDVYCRPEDLSAIIPSARQVVYRWLEENEMTNEAVRLSPFVGRHRIKMFVDANPRSRTRGKRKRGLHHTVGFDIDRNFVGLFNWQGSRGSFRK